MITGNRAMYKPPMKYLLLSASLMLGLVATMSVQAQDPEPGHDDGSRTCVNTRRIRRTVIVDDRNLLFYMAGGTVYHNILRQSCNGLKREGRFSYHTTGNSLCRLDSIRVLYDGAWGLREGISCSLGDFFEIDEETAEAMREGPEQPPEAEPLPLPEPEEIGAPEKTPETPPEEPES